MQKNLKYLILIMMIAFLLRIIPYINYPYLLTNDAMIDFQEIQYLQKNNQLALYHPYGRSFTLHLIVYIVSEFSGVSTWYINMFIPQLISSIGLLFLYLFVRRYFEEKYSIIAMIFAATFGPNVWWSSQAVRETIGLFFFTFVIYVFDSLVNRYGFRNLLIFFMIVLTSFFTHNWTNLLLFGVLVVMSVTLYNKRFVMGIPLAFSFGLGLLFYWYLRYFIYISEIQRDFAVINQNIFVITLSVMILYLVYSIRKFLYQRSQFILNKIYKNLDLIQIVLLFSYFLLFFVLYSIFYKLAVFSYPIQEFVSIFLCGFFATLGILPLIKESVKMAISLFAISIVLLMPLLYGLVIGSVPDFDPLRSLEYLIYPTSIFSAFGLVHSVKKLFRESFVAYSIFSIILIISGLLIYPPVFLLKEQISEKNLFYDVRSYIRYIPDEGIEIMKWGQKNNYTILSNNPNFNSLRDVLYPVNGNLAFLVSKYDYKVLESLSKINIYELGIGNPTQIIKIANEKDILFKNDWGSVYRWNENITNQTVLGGYVDVRKG